MASEDVAAGLLNWINSLKVTESVQTIDELATGEVLWKVLRAALLPKLSLVD